MSGDQCLRLLHDSFINEKRIFELVVRPSECGDEELEHTIQRLVFLIADPGRRLDVVSYRVTGIPILPQIGEVKPNSVAERQNGVFIEQGLPGEKGEAVALREDGKLLNVRVLLPLVKVRMIELQQALHEIIPLDCRS